jgi:hypothetical protein
VQERRQTGFFGLFENIGIANKKRLTVANTRSVITTVEQEQKKSKKEG